MRKTHHSIALETDRGITKLSVPVYSVNTLIIGAGAAGLKCAETLYRLGVRDIAVAVNKLGAGTSNNSGSDKQTYYKIGIFGDEPDSPMEFARSLFQGGMMHGDVAYVEALGSAPAFFDLCRIGVPFPFNRYGAYMGYKTDHDPRQRATSAGPKTSMMMFRRLLDEVRRQGTPILDRFEAVRLLTASEPSEPEDGRSLRVIGAVCLDLRATHRENRGITLFNTRNVVLATGGPGEMYRISVWPHGQVGSHGLALEAGVVAQNLTELQFGLASTAFRWNLSGSYQQVIPDYFSTAADGRSDRRHFLPAWFRSMPEMATAIFLKGYQWPFHAARVAPGGSSLVDIAVHAEIDSGRRVFLDFMRNPTPGPGMEPFSLERLGSEAGEYLRRSGATQETPYQRLAHMNPESIDLYAEHGIDLHEPLETAVCAQHCNGGLAGNIWWETSLAHLFAVGEVNGTHGVRPGGSALNSGQVGAMRAAQFIAASYDDPPPAPDEFVQIAAPAVLDLSSEHQRWLTSGRLHPGAVRRQIQERMSRAGAFIREEKEARRALEEARALWREIRTRGISCSSPRTLARATQDKLLALTSLAFLQAIVSYIEGGGGSRGAFMVLDPEGKESFRMGTGEVLRYRPENLDKRNEILELQWDGEEEFQVRPVPVRPLPRDDSWFETVWRAWNAGTVIR